jgi:hypothetical protein
MQQHMLVAIRQASQQMLIMGRLMFINRTLPVFAIVVKLNCGGMDSDLRSDKKAVRVDDPRRGAR